jgi:hypothetical protein
MRTVMELIEEIDEFDDLPLTRLSLPAPESRTPLDSILEDYPGDTSGNWTP